MTHKIALITDSGCDLPDELLQQWDVAMVPLYVIWGEEQLRDRVDIAPDAFYRRLVSDPVYPQTSQPTVQDFLAALRAAEAGGAEEALIITLSSGMSSTNAVAQQARDQAALPVIVLDSRANSLSQGWEVLAAARTRARGGTLPDLVEAAETVRRHLVTRLYVDTLEYLHRGGRIGRAAKWLGTILNLKPLLMVDHETGRIEPRERARNRAQALEKMIEDFFDSMDVRKAIRVGILHGNVPGQAQQLAERIRRDYDPVELIVGMTSPVMGVHTGPGAMALCGYAADE